MTAAVQGPASLGRLLGSVAQAMTRAVVLLAADMPAEWAWRHLDRQAVSGAPVVDHGVNRLPVVDQAGRPLGILTRDDVLRAVAACHQREPGGRDGA
jgi:predicted transcriptional regulator